MDVQEVASAIALVQSSAGQELTKRIGELFTDLLGPAAREAGELLADHIAYYRLTRRVALGEKTRKLLHGKTISHNPNLGRILPILEIASMESDEDLHSCWAAAFGKCSSCCSADILFQVSWRKHRSHVVSAMAAEKSLYVGWISPLTTPHKAVSPLTQR